MEEILSAIKDNSLVYATVAFDTMYDHASEALGWMHEIYTINSDNEISAKDYNTRTTIYGEKYLEPLQQLKTSQYLVHSDNLLAVIIRNDTNNYKIKKDFPYSTLYYKGIVVSKRLDSGLIGFVEQMIKKAE